MRRKFLAAPVFAALVLLAACSGDSGPYLELGGGSFIFNYRVAEATAGFALGVLRPLPQGAVVEASLENPDGGAPIVLRQKAGSSDKRFDFVTPALHGIKADKDYMMTIRLVGADGKELQKIEKNFRSNVDESVLPEKPLTIGPGYTPNPELPAPN
jgi:hypothetical protein